jgi:hypothetical protein
MRWTPYIAARLQTWQEKGLGNLHKLLALTGITLEEAQKQFCERRSGTPRQLRCCALLLLLLQNVSQACVASPSPTPPHPPPPQRP